jgi:ATP-dependent DNA helicase RecG
MTNPGGFLEGITLDNLLVHEPKPRNPRLAEACRRLGLVETTGRGIDKIYFGQLRYGRHLPDYTRSDRDNVRLLLPGGKASLQLAAYIFEQARKDQPLYLEDLLVLNRLIVDRRIDVATAGRVTQRGEGHARGVIERLVERGYVVGKREGKERVFHLSAALYRKLGTPAAYQRIHGYEEIRQFGMIEEYIAAHGKMTRREVAELCEISERQASHLLKKMVEQGKLIMNSSRRWTTYSTPGKL